MSFLYVEGAAQGAAPQVFASLVLLFVLALIVLLILSVLLVHGQRIVIGILLLILRVVLILILVLVLFLLHTVFLLYLQIHPFSGFGYSMHKKHALYSASSFCIAGVVSR